MWMRMSFTLTNQFALRTHKVTQQENTLSAHHATVRVSTSLIDVPIVLPHFFTDEECATVIACLDAYAQTGQHLTKKGDGHRTLVLNPRNEDLKPLLTKILTKLREVTGDKLFISDVNPGIHRTPFKGIEPHLDTIGGAWYTCSATCYVNDDFTGGEIFFPDHGITHAPRKGDLVIFSPTTVHGVNPMLSGTRYLIALWCTTDREHAWDFMVE